MTITRTIFCDNPTCADRFPDHDDTPRHVRTAQPPPYLPPGSGFIETRECFESGEELHHFCSWDCAMKYAATQPVEEIVASGPIDFRPPEDEASA